MYHPPIKSRNRAIKSPIQPAVRDGLNPIDGILGSTRILTLIEDLDALKTEWQKKIDACEEATETLEAHEREELANLRAEYLAWTRSAENAIRKIAQTMAKGDRGERGADGRDGKDGRDGESPNIDTQKIARSVLAMLPFIKKDEDKEEAEFDLHEIAEKKPLKTKHIEGLEQTLSALQNQTKNGYLHGGGVPSLTAGGGITLTPKTDGGFTVSASASLTPVEPTSGAVDDANKDFTFASKPVLVNVNGTFYRENKGWTWTAGTLTVTLDNAVGTGGDIFALL